MVNVGLFLRLYLYSQNKFKKFEEKKSKRFSLIFHISVFWL